MNKCIMIGRLTKDPELRTTESGINVANFSIAINRRFKNENGEYDADFFNCVAWRGAGETIAKYCRKGDGLSVVGEMQNRSYDAEDGSKRYVTELVVNDFEFLEKKHDDDNDLAPATEEENDELPF